MYKLIVLIFIILLVSCQSIRYNDGLGFFSENMQNYLINKEFYGGINSQVIRVRYLINEYDNDTLLVSFKNDKETYTILDTAMLYNGFSTSLFNCMSIFNKHNIYKYERNQKSSINNVKFENGIEYIIQIEDTIKVSYFFKFEEMDNNLRKMDFELLPNMISRKKNDI